LLRELIALITTITDPRPTSAAPRRPGPIPNCHTNSKIAPPGHPAGGGDMVGQREGVDAAGVPGPVPITADGALVPPLAIQEAVVAFPLGPTIGD